MKNHTGWVVYIPSALDLERHLVDNPPYEVGRFSYDKAAYLLSLFYSIPGNYKSSLEDTDGYINISAEKLDKALGSNYYNKYVEYFIRTDVIERDRTWQEGKFCMPYRLKDAYVSDPKPCRITTLSYEKKRISYSEDESRTKQLEFLLQWWNPLLTIDYRRAYEEVYRIFEENKQSRFKKTREQAVRTRGIHMLALEQFYRQEFDLFHADRTSGRLHTPMVKLKRELRKFVSYNGTPLVEVDVKNSQPFFGLALLDEQLFDEFSLAKTIRRYNADFDEAMYRKEVFESAEQIGDDLPERLVKSITTNGVKLDRITTMFHVDVLNGVLYETLRDYINESRKTPVDRQRAKKAYMNAAYERPWKKEYRELMQIFEKAYPKTYRAFEIIKTGENGGPKLRKGKEPHSALACTLQSLESDVILFGAAKRISEEYPDTPLYTVHDSIMTTEGNEELVKRILTEEIQSKMKFKPIITIG